MSGIRTNPPFPLLHSEYEPNSIQVGGNRVGGTVRVESSTTWPEWVCTEMRAKYGVVGDLDEYFHLPFVIEAGDTPLLIPCLNTDVSYLDTFLRFIDTTVNKKTN